MGVGVGGERCRARGSRRSGESSVARLHVLVASRCRRRRRGVGGGGGGGELTGVGWLAGWLAG